MYTWHDANYNKRLKLTIDGSKIKEDLYNFPIMIHLSNSSGITKVDTTCVFDELENNSKKIALYTAVSGSDTQCYVEVDYWPTSSGFEDAVLWAKIPTISSGTDLDLYLYYDKNVSDNLYVGHTGEYSAQQVWDSNFKAVYHLSQSPTGGNGCIKDSTGNNNNGTPHGNMTLDDLVDGKVGKALDFDGSDDYIEFPSSSSLNISAEITIEHLLKLKSTDRDQKGYTHCDGSHGAYKTGIYSDNVFELETRDDSGAVLNTRGNGGTSLSADVWYYLVGKHKDSEIHATYVNGVLDVLVSCTKDLGTCTAVGRLCTDSPSVENFASAVVDELRISNTARSDAWIKAAYYSFFDNLITYSTEEIKPSFIFSGYVKVNNTPVARTVYLYRRLTGEFVGSTISDSSTGYFEIPTPYDDYHFVVILPKLNEPYNIIAKDKIKYGD